MFAEYTPRLLLFVAALSTPTPLSAQPDDNNGNDATVAADAADAADAAADPDEVLVTINGEARSVLLPGRASFPAELSAAALVGPGDTLLVTLATSDAHGPWWLLDADGALLAHDAPRDGEAHDRVEMIDLNGDGVDELVQHRVDPTVPSCGDRFVPLLPRVFDAGTATFRPATIRTQRPADHYSFEAIEEGTRDRFPNDAVVRAVSSGAIGGGPGAAPSDLNDGSLATSWNLSGLSQGRGVGQFLVATLAQPVQLVAIELDTSLQGGRLPQRMIVDTDSSSFLVDIPEAVSARIVLLPSPITTSCVRLVVDSVAADNFVAIAELRVLTDLDDGSPGDAAGLLVERVLEASDDEILLQRVGSLLRGAPADVRAHFVQRLADATSEQALALANALSFAEPTAEEIETLLASPIDTAALDVVVQRATLDPATVDLLVAAAGEHARPSIAAVFAPTRMTPDSLIPLLEVASDTQRTAWLAAVDVDAETEPLRWLDRIDQHGVATQLTLLRAMLEATPEAIDPIAFEEREQLEALYRNDDGTVARLAVALAGRLCAGDENNAIASMAASDPAQHLRAEATRALARFAQCSNAAPTTLDTLAAALEDESATVRLAAAEAIADAELGLLFVERIRAARDAETWPEVVAALDSLLATAEVVVPRISAP